MLRWAAQTHSLSSDQQLPNLQCTWYRSPNFYLFCWQSIFYRSPPEVNLLHTAWGGATSRPFTQIRTAVEKQITSYRNSMSSGLFRPSTCAKGSFRWLNVSFVQQQIQVLLKQASHNKNGACMPRGPRKIVETPMGR